MDFYDAVNLWVISVKSRFDSLLQFLDISVVYVG